MNIRTLQTTHDINVQYNPWSSDGGTCQRCGRHFKILREGVPTFRQNRLAIKGWRCQLAKKCLRIKNAKVTRKRKGKRRHSDFPPGLHFVSLRHWIYLNLILTLTSSYLKLKLVGH